MIRLQLIGMQFISSLSEDLNGLHRSYRDWVPLAEGTETNGRAWLLHTQIQMKFFTFSVSLPISQTPIPESPEPVLSPANSYTDLAKATSVPSDLYMLSNEVSFNDLHLADTLT